MPRYTQHETDAVKRLLPYAERNKFIAELILNAYSSSRKVNMRKVMRYAGGEISGSTYRNDVFVLLELMGRGVESHEVVGFEAIDGLIKRWEEA